MSTKMNISNIAITKALDTLRVCATGDYNLPPTHAAVVTVQVTFPGKGVITYEGNYPDPNPQYAGSVSPNIPDLTDRQPTSPVPGVVVAEAPVSIAPARPMVPGDRRYQALIRQIPTCFATLGDSVQYQSFCRRLHEMMRRVDLPLCDNDLTSYLNLLIDRDILKGSVDPYVRFSFSDAVLRFHTLFERELERIAGHGIAAVWESTIRNHVYADQLFAQFAKQNRGELLELSLSWLVKHGILSRADGSGEESEYKLLTLKLNA